ncbi:MAG: N-acetylmuramoyl-L-alanine amidase [Symploca sp. SIO2E9]|nr:N-acetylmuramoyl-L-alanine amidase [Symploca sp. SIO2E9]
MRKLLGLALLGAMITSPVWAEPSLFLAYPPADHQTTAEKIFFIGTAPASGEVLINGKVIKRSPAGHFAPSFPLQVGENLFTLGYQNQEVEVKVRRLPTEVEVPLGLEFGEDSLSPAVDIARLPGELICFGAIAPVNAKVSVSVGNQRISLLPQSQNVQLPPNSAVLTAQNQPTSQFTGQYQACAAAEVAAELGQPQYQLSLNGETLSQRAPGKVSILSPTQLEVAEVSADAGVARTGPSTDYSRLTPLPKGTRATVTGTEGEWVRLDYGGWIKAEEVRILNAVVPPLSLIRSVSARQVEGATEVVFPLQTPVPVNVQQGDRTLTLTLYNTIAQTDTIYVDEDSLISRLDWQPLLPPLGGGKGGVQYTFHLKSSRQWGYNLRYEGTSLILSLRHPPNRESKLREQRGLLLQAKQSLSGIKILIDPGHGGDELGAIGPNGYPEKDINLVVSKLLQKELVKRGATVYMTRQEDEFVSLKDRVQMIDELEPAIALSIHYNALPDNGDAVNTAGVGMFWYHPQAQDLSVFLHNYLVKQLGRPSYGVFWNNLALTRPHTAPAVLLELGFMINPMEFEWIENQQEQKKLAGAIADGVTQWFQDGD